MFSSKDLYQYKPMRDHQTNSQQEEDVEAEDALSLCDLPIYSHSSSDDYYSNSHTSEETDETSNDLFEFFATGFSSNNSYQQVDSIVFCGKSIPCREAPACQERCTASPGHNKKRKRYFFHRIKRLSSSKSKLDCGSPSNGSEKNASKFKWCLLLFGLQSFAVPTRMDLADMRNRQSRSTPKSLEMIGRSKSTDSKSKGLSYLLRSLSCKGN